MKVEILKYFRQNQGYISELELKKKLNVKKEEKVDKFYQDLTELVEEGLIYYDDKHGYKLFLNGAMNGLTFGEVEINKKGNGYVHTKDGYTIFIDKNDLYGALNGDKVTVSVVDVGKCNDFKGEIKQVVKRKTGNVIFEVIGNGYEASIVPYNPNENVSVHINSKQYKDLLDGEIIKVNVGTKMIDNEYIANIEEVIGHKSDPGIDLKLIYLKNNVPIEFSERVIKEAQNLPKSVFEEELLGRKDLRHKNIISIDCDDTKDRDDAVYIEKLNNGNYKLYVSISHVSHYVKPGSALYNEAQNRCTSFYPNNTCNPMFPRVLSNGICSLNENVDRLTRTVEMEFNINGELLNYEIYLSVINTKKNMKYSEVNRVLNNEYVEGYEDYREQLYLLNELSHLLEQKKNERNYLNFNIPDLKVVHNHEGKVEGIKELKQGNAEKIIENFMLITGTTVAEHCSWLPFIYRVHEWPDYNTVENVIKTLTLSGYKLPKYTNIDEYTIKSILEHIETKEEAFVLKTLLLRSMSRARYDIVPIGHFALQLDHYCHFTSPIRRFADFRIHTIIDNIDTFDYNCDNINKLEQDLYEVAEATSKMERLAQDIENEALMMSMAEYMSEHIGEEFNAMVTDVSSNGMLVRTEELMVGKIYFEDLGNDKYHYDYDKKAIIGKKTHQRYQIGNKVNVIVKEASKENRTINFKINNKKEHKVLKKDYLK